MNRFADKLIVTPIDFSEEADRAVDCALETAASPEHVVAVHVAPPLGAFEPGIVYVISDEDRKKSLEHAFHERYSDPKYRDVRFEVLFGDPGHEIAQFAKDRGAGMIVMSSHGRTGLAHLLIGSVAERVVRLAQCPVLVLRD